MENGSGLSSAGLPVMERQGSRMQVDEDSRNARYQTDTFRMLGYKASPRECSCGQPLMNSPSEWRGKALARIHCPIFTHLLWYENREMKRVGFSNRQKGFLSRRATAQRFAVASYLCPMLALLLFNLTNFAELALKQGLSHLGCLGLGCQDV